MGLKKIVFENKMLYNLAKIVKNARSKLMSQCSIQNDGNARFTKDIQGKNHKIIINKNCTIYDATIRIRGIVKQLLNAIIIVMIPRLSALLGKNMYDDYNALLKKSFHAIVTLLMPAITGIFVLSYEIIWIIGGEKYAVGYQSLRVLSLALAAAVFANFYNNAILIPNKKEKFFLTATITAAIVNIALNFVLIPKLDYIGTAITTVIAEYIVLAFGIFFSKGLVSFKINWKDIISSGIGCVIIVLIAVILKKEVSSIILRTVLTCGCSIVSYLVVIIVLKNSYACSIVNQIKKKVFK